MPHDAILTLLVLLARTIPLVELTPFLGAMPLPRTVKLALAVGLAALIAPISGVVLGPGFGPADLTVLLITEASIGLALGFLGSLVFEGARMAGALTDRGVAAKPHEGPLERGYALFAICVFMLVGGHRLWLEAVARSYAWFPVGQSSADVGLALQVGHAAGGAVSLAVLLALPAIATAFVVDLTLAVIHRSASTLTPALNHLPVRALLVTGAVALGLGIFGEVFARHALDAMQAFAEASYVR